MGLGVSGWWLDLVTLRIFSNPEDSVTLILWTQSHEVPWIGAGLAQQLQLGLPLLWDKRSQQSEGMKGKCECSTAAAP